MEKNNQIIKNYKLIHLLGEGAHGKVFLCEKISSNSHNSSSKKKKFYAIKILDKKHIIDKNELEHTKAEKIIMKHIHHPFIISLKYSFVTQKSICFVMEFMKGGELFQHLRRVKRFSEKQTKFIAGCIILALGHLHNYDYIYRDLKPENVLFTESGYAKLTDFGLAKNLKNESLATTFCGTPEYMSPEVILNRGCNRTVDWWALGTLLYEMVYGIPPFYDRNVQEMYKKIVLNELKFKNYAKFSNEGKDFITKLLSKNPNNRLGAEAGSLEIMDHPWLKDMDWSSLMEQSLESPYNPMKNRKDWMENFGEFTKKNINEIRYSYLNYLNNRLENSGMYDDEVNNQFSYFHDDSLNNSMNSNKSKEKSSFRGSIGSVKEVEKTLKEFQDAVKNKSINLGIEEESFDES